MSAFWRRSLSDDERNRREAPWALGLPVPTSNGVLEVKPDPDGLMLGRAPLTPTQALMEAAPGDAPEDSLLEQQALREVLADAVDAMEPRDRWIFEAIAIRRLSVRQVATELNLAKSHVHRLYHRSRGQLQDQLRDHPSIAPRLRRDFPHRAIHDDVR